MVRASRPAGSMFPMAGVLPWTRSPPNQGSAHDTRSFPCRGAPRGACVADLGAVALGGGGDVHSVHVPPTASSPLVATITVKPWGPRISVKSLQISSAPFATMESRESHGPTSIQPRPLLTKSQVLPFRCHCLGFFGDILGFSGAWRFSGQRQDGPLHEEEKSRGCKDFASQPRPSLLERETGFEPATPTLARLCSTN
jgi:hypothetical protein